MAKRIAEVEVVAKLETKRYIAELKALEAATIAKLDAIGREKVRVDIDIQSNKAKRALEATREEILKTKTELSNLKAEWKGEDEIPAAIKKQIDVLEERNRVLKLTEDSQRRQLGRTVQAMNEYKTALKILGITEKEHEVAVKKAAAEVAAKTDTVRESTRSHKEHNAAIKEDTNAMRQFRDAMISDAGAVGKFNKVWSIFTNSKNPLETFKKTMREPVKLGPFTATVKGLGAAFVFLGPIIQGTVMALSAFAGVAGSALVGASALGIAAIGGFGLAFAGLAMVAKPAINEFKIIKQSTDAHTKAVLKYGAGSDQAKKKQQELNNVLKGVSPLARQMSTDLDTMGTRWGQMTKPAKNQISAGLADAVKTAKELTPMMANNTNIFAGGLTSGLATYTARLRETEKGGKGALGTMFKNAATSTGPLVAGLGNILSAMENVGASASRHLGPMIQNFRTWSQSVLDSTNNSTHLNGTIDNLMNSLKSVGRLFMAAGRFAKDFFGASQEAGRGLTDGLAKKFTEWDNSIKDDSGRKKLTDWFASSAELMRNLTATLGPLLKTTSAYARALTPLTAAFMGVSAEISKYLGILLRLPIVSQAVTMSLGALAVALIAIKVGGLVNGISALTSAFLSTKIAGDLFISAALAINNVAPRAATALIAIGTSSTLALGALGLLTVAIAGLVYGFQSLVAYNNMDDLNAKIRETDAALQKARDSANQLQDALQMKVDNEFNSRANYDTAKAQYDAAKGTKGEADALRRLQMANRDLQQAVEERGATERAIAGQSSKATIKSAESLDLVYSKVERLTGQRIPLDAPMAQLDDQIAKLQDRYYELQNQLNDPNVDPTSFDPAAVEAEIKQISKLTGVLEEARKKKQAYDRQKAFDAAVPAVNARIKAGMDGSSSAIKQALGSTAVQNQTVAVKIATTYGNNKDAIAVANDATKALQAGVSAANVTATIKANPKNAKEAINEIRAMAKEPIPLKVAPSPAQVQQALNELRNTVNGAPIEKLIQTKFANPKNKTEISDWARYALQSGVDAKIVARVIKGGKSPQDVIKGLKTEAENAAGGGINLKVKANSDGAKKGIDEAVKYGNGKTTTIKTKTDGEARRQLEALPTYKEVTIHERVVKDRATGGIVFAAASGFTKQTAYGNASRRPTRDGRAGGRINEPTLLVGEENRTEYVIATNPAYRAQNQSYLSAAANDLGMRVVPAASGYSPSVKKRAMAEQAKHIDNRTNHGHSWQFYAGKIVKHERWLAGQRRNRDASIIRHAIFDATDIKGEIKKARKRVGTLNNQLKNIEDGGIKGKERDRYNRLKTERNNLRNSLDHGALHFNKKNILGRSNAIKMYDNSAGALQTAMTLANKRGDQKAFNSSKSKRITYLKKLEGQYKGALRGASAGQRAQILQKLYDTQVALLDTRNEVFSPAAKSEFDQAIIDKQMKEISTLRNASVVDSAYASVAGGMLAESMAGGPLATGGPRMSSKSYAGSPSVVINVSALDTRDQSILSRVGDAATAGLGLQNSIVSPRTTVG